MENSSPSQDKTYKKFSSTALLDSESVTMTTSFWRPRWEPFFSERLYTGERWLIWGGRRWSRVLEPTADIGHCSWCPAINVMHIHTHLVLYFVQHRLGEGLLVELEELLCIL